MHLVFILSSSCKKYVIEIEGGETIDDMRKLLTESYGLREGFLLTTASGELVKAGTRLDSITGICDMFEITVSLVEQFELASPSAIEKPTSGKRVPAAESTEAPYSEENLQQLIDMSFNRDDAINALLATKDNLEEAVNILLSQAPAAKPVHQRAAMDAEIQEAFDKLSRQEKAAVNRLRKTGHDFNLIVETFLSCGKNEVQARTILAP